MNHITSTVPLAALPEPATPTLSPPRPRLWPAVVLVVVQWLIITVPGLVAPLTRAHFMGWFLGPLVATLGLVLWWLFASRLRWVDRGLGVLVFAAAAAAAWLLCDPTFGLFGLMLFTLPLATTAWVLYLLATPFLAWPVRRAGLLALFVLVWGGFTLVASEGAYGNLSVTLRPRWAPTKEDQYLAARAAGQIGGVQADERVVSVKLQPGDWPGFRGPDRDGRLKEVRIATDWSAHPPRQIWRHAIGPGWSSFAAVGGRLYTQEQRGPDEVVVCYDAARGVERWAHRDAARFTESMAGPGPRATPTFHDGKIYALGATGRLNCLDAAGGRLLWSRDIVADSGAKVPQWGFAASPLIVGEIVTVFSGSANGKSMLAYKTASGQPAWTGHAGVHSYCSPQPYRRAGAEQILIATDRGLTAFEPAQGKVAWQHDWVLEGGMARVVQPAVLEDGDVLLGTGFGMGTVRLHVTGMGDAWQATERWKSRAIKPYFNDLVVHRGHLYGFDNYFLTCVSLEDGKGNWKERGYGNGQVLLLADQDLLLVLSEKGEVALVEAKPEGHHDLARFQAIDGKTWNHPVVANGKLFVRNGEEAACYELSEAAR
jgi:outer membrane protein assembly factor BamB